jgi:hypothetical protein
VTDNLVADAIKRIETFHGYLENALRARDTPSAAPSNVADVLTKLWDLKQAGAITESEYADQKAKLLSA